jgi:hypothetical protein
MVQGESAKLARRKEQRLRNGRYQGLGRGWRKGIVTKTTRHRGDKMVLRLGPCMCLCVRTAVLAKEGADPMSERTGVENGCQGQEVSEQTQ